MILSLSEARAIGARQYWCDKPCPQGHLANRYVSSRACVVCAGQRKSTWAAKNQESVRQYQRKFQQNNKDNIRSRNQRWRANNPDRVKANKAAEYERNKEKILARNRLYRLSIDKEIAREADRRKREANPESYRAYKKNYKVRKKKASGSHTGEDIKTIFKAQRGKCAYCRNKVGKSYHVDHITPLALGGANDRTNLQITCSKCNHTKHAKDPIVFAQSLGMLL